MPYYPMSSKPEGNTAVQKTVKQNARIQAHNSEEPFRLAILAGVEVVQCDLLLRYPTLLHGLTTRRAPSDSRGVLELFAQEPRFQGMRVVRPQQVHGDHVLEIAPGDLLDDNRLPHIASADGLITREPQTMLVMSFADCVPVFIYDAGTPAIGLAHAGWRGTSLQVTAKTLLKMVDAFGTDPAECIVALGPAIGPCCYEIGPEVASAVSKSCGNIGAVRRDSHGRLFADLRICNASQLRSVGLPAENIRLSRWCTACNQEMFFSHRAENGRTGRMTGFIALT